MSCRVLKQEVGFVVTAFFPLGNFKKSTWFFGRN